MVLESEILQHIVGIFIMESFMFWVKLNVPVSMMFSNEYLDADDIPVLNGRDEIDLDEILNPIPK